MVQLIGDLVRKRLRYWHGQTVRPTAEAAGREYVQDVGVIELLSWRPRGPRQRD